MSERTAVTRDRIREVALDLFAEQGYEQTALREIAERLGVTKAALYYHFRSKDEIVEDILSTRLTAITELITWARDQPPSRELRHAVLRRFTERLSQPEARLTRFFERNQPALRSSPSAARLKGLMRELVRMICGPQAGPADLLRTGLALAAAHAAEVWLDQASLTDAERTEVVLTVGDELLDRT